MTTKPRRAAASEAIRRAETVALSRRLREVRAADAAEVARLRGACRAAIRLAVVTSDASEETR